jgi:signal transduction histidine kinase
MPRCVLICLFIFSTFLSAGQDSSIATIEGSLPSISDSFQLVDGYNRLSILFYEKNIDSTFHYAFNAREIATRLKYEKGIADAANNIGIFYDIKGESELSLRYYNNANLMYASIGDSSNVIQTWMNIAVVYYLIGKPAKGDGYFKDAFRWGSRLTNDSIMSLVYSNYVLIHADSISKDSTNFYLKKAYSIAEKYHDTRAILQTEQLMATRLIADGDRKFGLLLLEETVKNALRRELYFLSLDMLVALGDYYIDSMPEVTKNYYQQALDITRQRNYGSYSKIILRKFYDFYIAQHQKDSAFVYGQQLLDVYQAQELMNDSSSVDYIQYALKEQELDTVTKLSESNTKILILAVIVCLMAIAVALVLWASKQKAVQTNKLLQLQFQQLESTSQLLETNNENYARVLKVVAHDLRNPLANIFLLSQMIVSDEEVHGQSLDFAKLIHQVSNTCISQIGDLMSADLGIGEESVRKQKVLLDSLLSEAVMLMAFKAKEKKQELVLQAPDNLTIYADPEKLARVINNLLTNAIKFSPDESKIIIQLKAEANEVILSIKDAGIGIPKNMAATLFDPFTQSRRRGTAGEETFGLGLFITKKIVEAHHGHIWFESEVGKGTTFFIRLPVDEEANG